MTSQEVTFQQSINLLKVNYLYENTNYTCVDKDFNGFIIKRLQFSKIKLNSTKIKTARQNRNQDKPK